MAVSFRSRLFFLLYRALWRTASPLLKRSKRLADGWEVRHAPQGWLEPEFPAGEAQGDHATDIWLQAASGGEARLAVSICRKLDAARPLRVLAVTWTRQGRDVLEAALPELAKSHPHLRVAVRFAPFDHPDIARRALEQARPRLVALLETELWPGLMAACRELGIPICVINGRITSGTVNAGKRFPSLAAEFAPAAVYAISEGDRARFASLFPCPASVMPNIKFDLAAELLERPLQDAKAVPSPIFLFASVRDKEEALLPAEFPRIVESRPDARIIVTPRHLHRVEAWKKALADKGLSPLLASENGFSLDVPQDRILIWDRFGDLPQLYASASAVFVGGSFGQGGQNFLEALAAGLIPCIGPSADNFLWAMERDAHPSLEESGLLRTAQTPDEVISIMLEQAIVPADKNTVRERFREWLEPRLGASAFAAARLESQAFPHG